MLKLPLRDVWGIGKKTLERLNSAGIYTTRDVHDCSQTLLRSLFGESTGSFLYRTVRGIEVETFNEERGTRSLSSERTYSEDLTDDDVIDTALLFLCQEVVFRLIEEGWRSRTVHMKIRYEDFTTVSVSETGQRYISDADDLFERARRLFRRKREERRGIRLLGVGAQNLESVSGGIQEELFDFGEDKRRKVEQALCDLRKKNPKNVVQKARLLKRL